MTKSQDGIDGVAACSVSLDRLHVAHDFIAESVRPVVDRHTNSLPWTFTCNGMITRVHGWLRSLRKLDHPGDFQPILAGSRALFEIAADFVLIRHQENGSFRKLLDWEDSERLAWADKLCRSDNDADRYPQAAEFKRQHERRIRQLRKLHWERTDRVSRWTGRNLGEDAREVDRLGQAARLAGGLGASGFVEYYTNRYSLVCWFVHGSGLIGLRGQIGSVLPIVVAHGYHDALRFSVIASKYVLDLFKQYDDISRLRFEELEKRLGLPTDF